MPEINKVGGQLPINEQTVQKPNEPARMPGQGGEQNVGRDATGQPIGAPLSAPLTQNALMPEVVTGREASQLIAAEKLRTNAGESATDVLLGLNRQPSVLGGLLAPPGNIEALRHLSPTIRRKILRNLLDKQRGQMRRLVAVARDQEQHQPHDESDQESPEEMENLADGFHNRRVYQDLSATTKMLDLLDELMNMQDYTLSQMGTFAHG